MPRWFKRTLWALLALAALLFVAYQLILWDVRTSEWTFSGSSDSHWEARAEFRESLTGPTCLTREIILEQAQARGFMTWDLDGPLRWCHRPTGLTDWLGVEVRPGQMMSTQDENSEYFGFDGQGCAVPWVSDSGEGTTCP